METFSLLAGAIWKINDDLAVDVGIRQAWINRQPVTEIRAGVTFAISAQKEGLGAVEPSDAKTIAVAVRIASS